MVLTYVMFLVAFALSAVAAFYSIAGLTAIFAAAVIPIIMMGSLLEVAKLAVTVWLHEYWSQCKLTMKLYLSLAVCILMLITSMGIFGFLSKAHSDQGMVSGDVQAKIAIYDEKIRTAKENIDANRKALKQLDEAVDQVMGRSTTEAGADKAVAVRRAQQAERRRLLAEIEAEQKKISSLGEERAPIAAEVRKVEAEVGPIKYIAALIYDDAQDANALERAVRWVIIMLVIVFDPLAVMMLLAATESLQWERDRRREKEFQQALELKQQVAEALDSQDTLPVPEQDITVVTVEPAVEDTPVADIVDKADDDADDDDTDIIRQAKALWKMDNPGRTLKEQRRLLERNQIDKLPWMDYVNDPRIKQEVAFGNRLPTTSIKGDQYILINHQPTKLFKYNGISWIEVSKDDSDTYAYNQAYIDHLIQSIGSGQYDPELLTDSEKIQIEQRLRQET